MSHSFVGVCLTKRDPDKTIVHASLPNAEFAALAKLRGPRTWRDYFWNITEDARKAAEINQKLREENDHLKERLRRAEQ